MAPVPVHSMAELVDESRFHFSDKRIELQVCRGTVDLESSGEVEGAVGEVEVASIHPAETEMKGCGGERWGGEVDVGSGWSEGGGVEEDRGEVRRPGHEHEPVCCEDYCLGERVVRVARCVGPVSVALGGLEVYPHVTVELAGPHVCEVIAQFVSPLCEVASSP